MLSFLCMHVTMHKYYRWFFLLAACINDKNIDKSHFRIFKIPSNADDFFLYFPHLEISKGVKKN